MQSSAAQATPPPSISEDEDLPAIAQDMCARFDNASAKIAIVGLGYVGLPLARALHSAGFDVLGFDVDPRKIEMLGRGESYLLHLGDELSKTLAASERFEATCDSSLQNRWDAVCLSKLFGSS